TNNGILIGDTSGIYPGGHCRVGQNNCDLNGNGTVSTAGIHITGTGNRVEGNNLVLNNFSGIETTGITSNNFIVVNSAHGSTNNFNVNAEETQGPEIIGSGTIFTNNPWANFAY